MGYLGYRIPKARFWIIDANAANVMVPQRSAPVLISCKVRHSHRAVDCTFVDRWEKFVSVTSRYARDISRS